MEHTPTVLITGAAGTLGRKLAAHLEGRFDLRLLDRVSDPEGRIAVADLSRWYEAWVRRFEGVDTVFHFAADPEAWHPWPDLIAPNLDALIHVYQAAVQAKARRFVFASSNHVMGGYQDEPDVRLTPELPPRPGLRYTADGQPRNSAAYGSAKLFGERLGKCYSESHGLEVIAVRLGWVLRGRPNEPGNLPKDRGEWFRSMWLSDRDFCQLMERCLLADLPARFLIVNGMSSNAGMRWDLANARQILGYEPRDDVNKG